MENNETVKAVASPSEEIAVQPNYSIESLLAKAIEKGTPVETLERLLIVFREIKAQSAKSEFDNAMAAFQGACPVIKKDKAGGKTDSGQVAYYYAPIESIVSQVKGLLKDNGFSYMIQTETGENNVKVVCTVKHTAGHSESSQISVPLGAKTRVMSDSQVVASALTFAKRYAFCNAFGIMTGDSDDDSNQTKEKELPQVKVVYDKPEPTLQQQIWSKIQILAPKTPYNKTAIENVVLEKTQLPLIPANLEEINDRLGVLISEIEFKNAVDVEFNKL